MPRNPVGRPSTYDPLIAHAVLWEIAHGKPISSFRHDPRYPTVQTIYEWGQQFAEFGEGLQRARETASHVFASEGVEIADDTSRDTIDGMPNNAAIGRDRLRIESRRWLAGKYNPAAYADKQLHTGPDGQSAIQIEHSYRFDQLDPDELQTLRRLLRKARAPTIEG
jgi:hypothetical protein